MPTLGLNLERAGLYNYTYRLDLGQVAGRAVRIWGANLIPFTLLAYALNAPVLGLAWLFLPRGAPDMESFLLDRGLRVLAGVANLALAGAVTYGTHAAAGRFERGGREQPDTGEILSVGLSRTLPVMATAIMAQLAISLALCALIIPSIIVACALFVAVPVTVLERPGVLNALSRSAELTTDNRWAVLGLMIVSWVVTGLAPLVLSVVWELMSEGTTSLLTGWLITALLMPLAPFDGVLRAVCYHDLRVGREGAAVEDLVSVFD